MAETVLETPAKRWAREYELIYILKPNVDPDDAEKLARRLQEIIASLDGKLTKVDIWGKRKLAYLIDRHTRGIFVYLTFVGYGEIVAELERNLRLSEPVIRYQTIVTADQIDLEAVEIDDSEIEFARIEHEDDEEAELTTAQRLGMEERRPEQMETSERSDDDDDTDSDGDDDDDDMSSDDSDDSGEIDSDDSDDSGEMDSDSDDSDDSDEEE